MRIAVEWYSATPDKTAVVRDLGLALLQSWPRDKLRASKNVAVGQRVKKQDVISVSEFMREWKKWAGSEQDLCQMDLLKVSPFSVAFFFLNRNSFAQACARRATSCKRMTTAWSAFRRQSSTG